MFCTTKRMGMLKLARHCVIIAATCCPLFFSCAAKKEAEQEPTQDFQVTQPAIVDTSYNKEFVADIQSLQNVELRSRVKGFVEKIYVDEGKPVQAGQPLFSISNKAFKEDLLKANAQLKSAIAELKSVEVEMKNTRLLVKNDVVSNTELELLQAKKEAVQAKIEEAKSAIGVAQLNLSFTQVRAPFAGIINRIPKKVGSVIDEGTLLTTISNNKEVFAYFNMSEQEYLDIMRRRQLNSAGALTLIMANGQEHDQKGTLETADSEVDKGTGNIAFRARFANPQGLLKHGSSAKLLLQMPVINELVVPQKSTFELQDKLYVYVVDTNNIAHMRPIEPKLRLANLFVVGKGLSHQDRIVYEGVQLVKDGEKINPKPVQWSQVMAQLAQR